MRRSAIGSVVLVTIAMLPSYGCISAPSCSIADDGAGTATLTCDDGSSFAIHSGAPGTDGTDGTDGKNGTDGNDGGAGTSCTVAQVNGATTISCDDGSTATITTGGGSGGLPAIPKLEGSYTVNNAADIAILQGMGVTEITGALNIFAAGLTDLSGLSGLTKVGGNLQINFDGTSLKGLENVTDMGGLLIHGANLTDISAVSGIASLPSGPLALGSSTKLTEANFPNLTTVAADCNLGGAELTKLALPKLTTCKHLYLGGLPKLQAIDLPEFTTTNEINVQTYNDVNHFVGITSFSAPKLTTATQLYLLELSFLKSLSLPALKTVKGAGGILIRNVKMLPSVSLPELTETTSFQFQNDEALTSVKAPKLTTATDLGLFNCPLLPTCVCTNFGTQLMMGGNCGGNNEAGVCN